MKEIKMKKKDYSSEDEEEYKQEVAKVILTPMSKDDFVVYDYNFKNDITEKLNPIGHPNPGVGSYYNCHGWALGYKEWINIGSVIMLVYRIKICYTNYYNN